MIDRRRSPTESLRFVVSLYGLALFALVVSVVLFAKLGRASRVDDPNDLDNVIHDWVVGRRPDWPALTLLFRWATLFGNPDVATVATAVITFALYVLNRMGLAGVRRTEPFVWLGTILGGRLLSISLKLVYRRDRPPLVHRLVEESTYSFPSGHSVFAAVFFIMLAYLVARMVPTAHSWARAVAVVICVLLALLIGASRVWLGVHYPTDVLGGLLLGLGWVSAVWLARVAWDQWRWRHRALRGA